MMRKHLPEGLCSHNLNPETLLCPICSSKLKPSEIVFADNVYELWYVECPECQTEYLTRQEPGKLTIPQPITRDYITSLERRIAKLERLILQSHVVAHPKEEEEIIPKEYSFLLNT